MTASTERLDRPSPSTCSRRRARCCGARTRPRSRWCTGRATTTGRSPRASWSAARRCRSPPCARSPRRPGSAARLGPLLGDVPLRGARGPQVVRYWVGEAWRAASSRPTRGRRAALGRRRARRRAADLRARPGRAAALRARIGRPHVDDRCSCGTPRPAAAASGTATTTLRPLSASGREQARAARPSCCRCSARTASSARRRCAAATRSRRWPTQLGLPVDDEPLLGEDGYWERPATRAWRACASWPPPPGVTVVCSQGGVIPDVVARAGARARPYRLPVDPYDRAVPQGEHLGARLRGVGAALGRLLLAPDGLSGAYFLAFLRACGAAFASAFLPFLAAGLRPRRLLRLPSPEPSPRRSSARPSWPPPSWPRFSAVAALRRLARAAAGFAPPWLAFAAGLAGCAPPRPRRPSGAGRACGGALASPPTAALNPVPGRNAGTVVAGTATVCAGARVARRRGRRGPGPRRRRSR